MINDVRKRKVTKWRILPFPAVRDTACQVTDLRRGSCKLPGSRVTGVLRMKSSGSLVRLKEFQVNDKRRQLNQIQLMMAEFERMAAELEYQIAAEEKKAGISDPAHFAYPTFAKAARQRADNLQGSIRELRVQQDAAELALEEAESELQKATALEERDGHSRGSKAG